MKSIIDFIIENKNNLLSAETFTELDGLCFALFSYVNFSKIKFNTTFYEVAKLVKESENNKTEFRKKCYNLFLIVSNSERYKNITVSFYKEKFDINTAIQFYAVTFKLPSDTLIVSFRGTDNSIIGWKEDFSLSFAKSVPAQKYAEEYLKFCCEKTQNNIVVSGHSKGGNLAVYSFLKLENIFKSKVSNVFSFDGPGFNKKTLEDLEFKKDAEKILTVLPQSSVIGVLLEHTEPIEVVLSNGVGIFQHDPFKWHISNNQFVRMPNKKPGDSTFDRTIRLWLESVDDKQKEEFINEVFSALTKTGLTNLKDLIHNPEKTISTLAKAYSESDETTKQTINTVMGKFFRSAAKSISYKIKGPKNK